MRNLFSIFVKQGEMKKIHLAESYGRSYFVGKEKNVQYYIKCLEIGYDDSYEINFICGTAILKNGESTEDIFDCLFDDLFIVFIFFYSVAKSQVGYIKT